MTDLETQNTFDRLFEKAEQQDKRVAELERRIKQLEASLNKRLTDLETTVDPMGSHHPAWPFK